MLAAGILNFWALAKEGYSNEYYAAAVKSMLQNPSAFFFASFDSGLYVTVDKPPLGLWLQALSAKVFGVNSFGLIFPSAIAGVLCVLIVYRLAKRFLGETGGVLAAAVMAVTPIITALSRTNNLDMLLLLFLLLGAGFVLKATQRQSLKHYIIAMVFLGLAFNIKMLQAYLVLPAFVFVYFMGKGRALKKILHTLLSLVVLAVVSLSWAITVDSIPASERPYIGSSSGNSVTELALGYNGIQRLNGMGSRGSDGGFMPGNNGGQTPDNNQPMQGDGSFGMPGGNGLRPQQQGADNSGNNTDATPQQGQAPFDQSDRRGGQMAQFQGRGGNAGGPGGEQESGTRGVLRLMSTQLSGLVSWFLLPAAAMAVLACAGVCCLIFRRKQSALWSDEKRERLMHLSFWAAWLVTMAVFFSIGGFIHRYYVGMLSPAIAVLASAAALAAWRGAHRRWLVPLAFAATLAAQCIIAARTSWAWMLIPMLVAGGIAVLLFLFRKKALQILAAVLMAAALLAAPAAWSLTPVMYTGNATIPDAGPDTGGGGFASGMRNRTADEQLTDYLAENYGGERWAVAVDSANAAAPIILETGLPVMAIGGFSGGDAILTLEQFKQYVADGSLRFYLASGEARSNSDIESWAAENGTRVTLSGVQTLYDLKDAG